MLGDAEATATAPLYRPTSRVVVIDGRSRILLLRLEDSALDVPLLWITPGGGVSPGETYEQAALRELHEETGIVAPLGPCIWHRRVLVRWGRSLLEMDERYYAVRVDEEAVVHDHREEIERTVITAHRWWSLEELEGTTESFAPRGLVGLLPPILAGQYPVDPLTIGV